MTATSNKQPFRVLSLDGGGMRGTYTATYLERVAGTFAKKRGLEALDIGAAFDLIVGTSTGGIIACALATGIPLAEVISLYAENGPRIWGHRGVFPKSYANDIYGWVRALPKPVSLGGLGGGLAEQAPWDVEQRESSSLLWQFIGVGFDDYLDGFLAGVDFDEHGAVSKIDFVSSA
jgi:Patatin-like phospholipase